MEEREMQKIQIIKKILHYYLMTEEMWLLKRVRTDDNIYCV